MTLVRRAVYRIRRELISLRVNADARTARSQVTQSASGRGLFIDCGVNLGQGFAYFKQYFPPELYDYILIEPNPHCVAQLRRTLRDSAIEIIEAAVSPTPGVVRLYGMSDATGAMTSQGSTTLRDHPSAWEVSEASPDSIVVQTVSLTELLRSKRGLYGYVVVKLDVEGAEYDVLEDLIGKGTHRDLDCVYVEFHSQYMKPEVRPGYQAREAAIQVRFEAAGVLFRTWI